MNVKSTFQRRRAGRWQVLCGALLLDALLRDPPNRLHPVAWLGSGIAAARGWVSRWPGYAGSRVVQFGAGLTVLAGGATVAALAGWSAQWLVRRGFAGRWSPLGWLLEAWLLQLLLSLRGLTAAAAEVETALQRTDLPEARRLLSWHLVSRDTSELSASEVAAAAIESVAENASDSVVAPLSAYALAGLPGALLYRFVNTADAMLGYRDPAREWLGKAPARTDDLLNWLPARLTALLVILAARTAQADGVDARAAQRTWRRDHAQTDSPNAGHPMSAMAGALSVQLTKRGQYTLGAEHPHPGAKDIGRANRLVRRACMSAALLLSAVALLRSALRH